MIEPLSNRTTTTKLHVCAEREYEDRVQKALTELREVYESQMRESKEGFNKQYEKKVRGKTFKRLKD
jgi:hypothetical protein